MYMNGMGAASSFAGIAAGAMSAIDAFTTAKKQKKKAEELAQASGRVVKGQIPTEYLKGDKAADLMAMQGMAGKDRIDSQIEEDAAKSINAIRRTSGGGANAAAATAALLSAQDKGKRELAIQDEMIKQGNKKAAINWKDKLGMVQKNLESQKIKERDDLLSGAAQLENASEQNRRRGVETLGTTMTSAFGGMSGMGGGGGGQKETGISTGNTAPSKSYVDTITPAVATQITNPSASQSSPSNYDQYSVSMLQSMYDDYKNKGQDPPIELVASLNKKKGM